MLLLTTTSYPTMLKWRHPNHGRLLTPRHWNSAWRSARSGFAWAIDNDGFGGFDPARFQKMIFGLAGVPGCLFVNAPDAFDKEAGVGDHEATLELWREWRPLLAMSGFPVSFVLQNGATVSGVPWDELDAVFVGGCTDWKLGHEAAAIVREAKRRGKWAHMGRVNSVKRMKYAHSIGCDSVDGSGWAKFRDAMMPMGLRALEELSGKCEQLVMDV